MLGARPLFATLLWATVAAPTGPDSASARHPVFQPSGVVTGMVYDSLASAPLADADVQLVREDGTTQGFTARRVAQAPLQFGGTTPDGCGVIVIWRKAHGQ